MANEAAELSWLAEVSEPEEREPRSRWLDVAYAVLLLMGVVALFATGWGAYNHIQAGRSTLGLNLEITGFQFIDDDNLRAVIHFRLHNDSALAMEIDSYYFHLLLNGEQVATSFSIYRGTDPNEDLSVYSEAATIKRRLAPNEYLDLEFTQHIHPRFMDIVRRARNSRSMSWTTIAFFHVVPPFARHRTESKTVELRASFEQGDNAS